MPQIQDPASGPELFIGLAGAVGTDLDLVYEGLQRSLAAVGYTTSKIHLAALLGQFEKYKVPKDAPVDEYTNRMMTAGDEFRRRLGRNDAVAILGIASIADENRVPSGKLRNIRERHAYIFRSLKHPDEVRSLRAIYGPSFYLVAAYSPEAERKADLASRIAKSRGTPLNPDWEKAERLIDRDRSEVDLDWGQGLEATFHLADLFVDVRAPQTMSAAIERFVQLIFGHPFLTPTKEENAMYQAQAAALRSAEPGRQVGAVVVDGDGSLVAVGVNEVPKFGGGFYWCGDENDGRQFKQDLDSAEAHRIKLIGDTLGHLRESGWLSSEASSGTPEEIALRSIQGEKPVLSRSSMIRNVIEFGRAVHAEMAAVTEAARRGVSIAGCTMYVTTFPCHLCARHIVAAGILRVQYIEPYSRSLARELYPDSIDVDPTRTSPSEQSRVIFEPFLGVAPRRYLQLFTAIGRKDKVGNLAKPPTGGARPKSALAERAYLFDEELAITELRDKLKQLEN